MWLLIRTLNLPGVARITVRRAFLHSALKRLGLDTDPDVPRPQDQQIVLVKPDDDIGSDA